MPISDSIVSLTHETTASFIRSLNESGLGQFFRFNSLNESFSRKIFIAGSVTALGVAASALGYRIYRKYALNKNVSESNRLFQQIDFETNLTKSMRSSEEIEEVDF